MLFVYIYIGMDQYLLVPFLGGWTSINPSYFDVNYRGTRFWPIAIYVYWRRIKEKMPGTCVWVHSPSPTDCPPFGSNMNSSRRLSPWDPMKTPMFAAYTVIFHHFCQLNHCYSICLPVKLRHVSPFLVVKLVKPLYFTIFDGARVNQGCWAAWTVSASCRSPPQRGTCWWLCRSKPPRRSSSPFFGLRGDMGMTMGWYAAHIRSTS